MFTSLLSLVMANILYFALHIEGSTSFPKPLTQKMEQKYFEEMGNGDENARNKLIEHNLRLVAHIIKKYYSSTNDPDDLISIGTIGLIKAVNTFSYDKGTKFATYASRCIENEILMHFRAVKKTANDVFISDPIEGDGEGNSLSIMDLVSDDECIIDCIDLKLKSEKLYEFIQKSLTTREQLIIKLRYGLNGSIPLTQNEVSKKLKISRSYVSRIEKKVISVLKKEFEKSGQI